MTARPCRVLIPLIAWGVLSISPTAIGQLTPRQTIVGINRPVPVGVDCPPDAQGPIAVHLVDPELELVARATISDPGEIDLAALFPMLWTRTDYTVLFAQLVVGESDLGAPLVIQALDAPARAEDGLTSRVRHETVPLRDIAALPPSKREELGRETIVHDPDPLVRSGIRVWVDQRVVLDTDAGEIELALRPDAAPNTCRHFLSLVHDGLYVQMPFHRVIAADALGRPFIIQTGDPTGTGAGGCGQAIDFEPSPMLHDFGVVSMARRADDPNSASSQFFICLSREACAPLDGRYTAFAEVVRGREVIATIAASPTGAQHRPIDPPILHRARAIPAPSIGVRRGDADRAPSPPEPESRPR